MAISTYKTYLCTASTTNSTTTYTKLIDIKDFPDIPGSPETLDTTTLSDKSRTYILGIQETETLSFTCNFDASLYGTISGYRDTEKEYALIVGGSLNGTTVTPPAGSLVFEFKGYADCTLQGGGVNEVVNMVVTIAPSSEITVTQGSNG